MPSKEEIEDTIKQNKIVVYSKTTCPFCTMAKESLKNVGAEFLVIELDRLRDGSMGSTQDILKKMTGAKTVPRVFINGKCIGGGSETKSFEKSGELQKMIAGTN